MKPQTVQKLYDEIAAYIKEQSGASSSWYCGITSSWLSRLFEDHQVPKEGHPYIARQCYTSANARAVETELLKLGCDGAPGGGDETSVYIYAYLKGTMTNP